MVSIEKNKNPVLTKKIALALGLMATVLAGPKIYDNVNGPEFFETTEYTVQPGDTLTSIVGDIPGSEKIDLNAGIYKITEMNNLDSSSINAGQTINIPKRAEP